MKEKAIGSPKRTRASKRKEKKKGSNSLRVHIEHTLDRPQNHLSRPAQQSNDATITSARPPTFTLLKVQSRLIMFRLRDTAELVVHLKGKIGPHGLENPVSRST